MVIQDVLPKLQKVKSTKRGHWIARCPAHDDRSPSLSISEVAGGKVLVHCFTGCTYESIISALGIDRRQTSKPFVPYVPIKKAIEGKPLDARGVWQRWLEQTDHYHLDGFGMSLGVDTDCLTAIGCAWSTFNAWAFPMRDERGNVIGIRLRNNDGHKWAVKGSKAGLFIPSRYPFISDRVVYLVEGPTDLAAAMTIGLRAFGRAACTGQENFILQYIALQRIERLVIVTDNDDPGIRGAEKLQSMLSIPSCIWIPPTKDIREFLNIGGDYNDVQSSLTDLVWSKARRAA